MPLLFSTQPPEFATPTDPINLPIQRCVVGRQTASRRILIVRPFANGDILMGTPLLAALRTHFPDAHLTWLVERREQQAIDANPHIDELLLWSGDHFKKPMRRGLIPLWLLRVAQLRRQIAARGGFDVLISLQPEDWPFLPFATGAPVRIGVFDTFRKYHKQITTSRRARLYTHPFVYEDLPDHRSEQYLLPLHALGLSQTEIARADRQMRLGFTDDDARAVETFLRENGLSTDKACRTPLAVIAPMAGWPSRCWPPERYEKLVRLLQDEYKDLNLVLVGSDNTNERAVLQKIASAVGSDRTTENSASAQIAVAAGTLTFRQLAALIARANVLVGSDSGPMHMAAALGTPYVALFGPTPAASRAPLVGRGTILQHPVPCGPCDLKICPLPGTNPVLCMKRIEPAETLRAVRHWIAVAAQ